MNMEVEGWKSQSMVYMFIATKGRKYGVPNIGVASAMFDIWSPLSNFHGVNRSSGCEYLRCIATLSRPCDIVRRWLASKSDVLGLR